MRLASGKGANLGPAPEVAAKGARGPADHIWFNVRGGSRANGTQLVEFLPVGIRGAWVQETEFINDLRGGRDWRISRECPCKPCEELLAR